MKQLFLLIFVVFSSANSQTVNNVRVVGLVDYIVKVLQETVSEVERREWCNLKLSDFVVPIDEQVIDRHYEGTVTYTNGFVVSIQQIDILQSSVQQIWAWNSTTRVGTVSLRGTLRLTGLKLGYDVVADMADGHHRYTATFTHPLISFAFFINYSIENESIDDIVVVGTVIRLTTVLPNIFPKDTTSDVLTVLFNSDLTADGINAWGPDVFRPITTDVVARVDFPRICYDCPITF